MSELETPLSDEVERVEELTPGQRCAAFRRELEDLINKHSMENVCNVPDYMLAEYLVDHLFVVAKMVNDRDKWFDFVPFGDGNELR